MVSQPESQCSSVCALTRGSEADWVPFAFPRNSHLLLHRCCFETLSQPYLPVTHQLNARGTHVVTYDNHFYYYASGCSDTYLRAGRSITARNRYHAFVKLLQLRRGVGEDEALEELRRRYGLRGCGVNGTAMMTALYNFNPCASQLDDMLLCALRSRMGIGVITSELVELMRQLELDTLVLAYESPGGATVDRLWKTEIMRRLPFIEDTFYSASLRRCRMRNYKGCMACNESNLSTAACGVAPRTPPRTPLGGDTPQREAAAGARATRKGVCAPRFARGHPSSQQVSLLKVWDARAEQLFGPTARRCLHNKTPPAHVLFCNGGPLASSQRSWLQWLAAAERQNSSFDGAGAEAPVGAYFQSLYGAALAPRVNVAALSFFWHTVPRRESFKQLWSCSECTMHNLRPEGVLWAPNEVASLHPSLGTKFNRLMFPGVLVHHTGSNPVVRARDPGEAAQVAAAWSGILQHGVPDDHWVEVIRVARRDTARRSTRESRELGQVWFILAVGSGIWINVGKSKRFRNIEKWTGCVESRKLMFDTVQLQRSLNNYFFELIDCRGAGTPGAKSAWTSACPPDHITLRLGTPSPRFSPGLPAVDDAIPTDSCVCDCNPKYDFLNCLGSK